jgi:hypothetical protein
METMSEQYKPFEIRLPSQTYVLRVGNCAVNLFRQQAELDFISHYTKDGEETIRTRIFNNQPLAHWLVGCEVRLDEGNIYRVNKRIQGVSFREQYGWNPMLVEREQPNEEELDAWFGVQEQLIDQEWEEFSGE